MADKIIIVDDDHDIINLFSEVLELNGYTVSAFTDPLEALINLQNKLNDYDLILCDFKMPLMNGNDLCLKLVIQNPNLKVILMSAYTDIEYNKSFQFISKPIQITRLLEIVKENLRVIINDKYTKIIK